MEGAPPAGWHPDPANPTSGAQRYWDGNQWTEQVRPAPVAPPSYPPPPAASGSANYPTYDSPPPYGQQPFGQQPPFGQQSPFGQQPFGQQPPFGGPPSYGQWGGGQPQSLAAANRFSAIAVGVSILYLVIAATAHIVILGILPIGMAIRAMSRKEKLAPVALVFAIVALIVGVAGFTHH
ncbi:MAG TPA: DUF2510 domain-containing protein [Acidimicrobiales bacterium]|jgi:hypothetical protein|nr:DUF2510 domain-containing protein [Acidimicrobiales bacterium]